MKGIILAGGHGTRLYPLTKYTSKQLLPVYDKPMIYYPLSVLMQSDIKDILIITNPEFINIYRDLLGDGSHLGITVEYQIQLAPKGIAEAFILGENFIGDDNVCLILGDNLFFGESIDKLLSKCIDNMSNKLSTIIGYEVKDPERFGVVEFDKNNHVMGVEEKPSAPKSNFAVTGLYFYTNDVIQYAKSLKPSDRGELEITDLNNIYIKKQKMVIEIMDSDTFKWLDSGTFAALHESSTFIMQQQEKSSAQIALLDEIAFLKGFISKNELKNNLKNLSSDLQEYLSARYLSS
jgi:glucose-1-phosphate thymidylyltransferase